jgi:hypothetical protein
MGTAERQKPAPGELVLDHVSHFVPDLGAAARVLEALGFRVTPVSVQQVAGEPVGASNRCVMLEEGYIELLTPTHDTPTAQAMRARMAAFVGVHLACFGTPDAEGEHARLASHGFSPQPLVHLQRDAVRFKVVRPALDAMPEGRVQYVEQLTPHEIWREENLRHTNGVLGLSAVYVCAHDVPATAARWSRFTGLLPRAAPAWAELRASRGSVVVLKQDVLEKQGAFHRVPAAPALAGYALRCRQPGALAKRCAAHGLRVARRPTHWSVALPPALGGAWVLWG